MTATKPLDLAAFERSHAKEIEIDADAGALPIAQFRHIRAAEQYAALLAECKRQRIEFGNLSKAAELLQHISDGQREELELLRSGAVRAQTDRREALGMNPKPGQCPHCRVDSSALHEQIKALVEALRRTMQHAEHSTIEWIDANALLRS